MSKLRGVLVRRSALTPAPGVDNHLKNRYASLRAKAAKKALGSVITATPAAEASILSVHLQEKIVATAARNAQKRKASEVQLAYRLAGHTVLPLSSDRTAVRFDTCYNGEYFEQYYVVLEFKSGSVDVVKHTLPHFVPLDEAKRHLEKDMTQFFREVSDYLNAFVTRRQQLVELQSLYPAALGGTIEASPGVDYIRFTTTPSAAEEGSVEAGADDTASHRQYQVLLVFGDLLAIQASRCSVTSIGPTNKRRRWRDHEKAFTSLPCAQAYANCFL